jgi:hypothetical protein
MFVLKALAVGFGIVLSLVVENVIRSRVQQHCFPNCCLSDLAVTRRAAENGRVPLQEQIH